MSDFDNIFEYQRDDTTMYPQHTLSFVPTGATTDSSQTNFAVPSIIRSHSTTKVTKLAENLTSSDLKPKRPLSAYNIFFKKERQRILAETPTRPEGKPRRSHGKIGFADLARRIAGNWNSIDEDRKAAFEKLAATDKKRYLGEMEVWKRQQEESHHAIVANDTKAAPSCNSKGQFESVSLYALLNRAPNNTSPSESASVEFHPSYTHFESLERGSSVYGQDYTGPIPDDIAMGGARSSAPFGQNRSHHAIHGFPTVQARLPSLLCTEHRPKISDLATKMDNESVDFLVNMFR
jgi:hypothetical protein